jgi:hypothetical protein
MPDAADLIWIVEASIEFKRSRDWLDAQIKEGNLARYTIPGDKRVYVSRREVTRLLAPRRDDEQ